MKITDLNGKKICILGFGKEGQAMLTAIERYAPHAEVTISDRNEKIADQLLTTHYSLLTGPHWLEGLDRFDVLIKSPGIPPLPKLTTDHLPLTTPTEIFFDSIAGSKALTIGVTGSKGKSTTASLIAAILKVDNRNVVLVGNIGEPAIAHLAEATHETIFVMELSSYQLMDLKTSPHVAVVTSFFPEHLDYHGSVEAYLNAKKNITRHQSDGQYVFFCSTSTGAAEIAKEGDGTKIPFSADDAPVAIEETHLLGMHNLSNIAGAFIVAEKLGVPRETAIEAIRNFHGLPHRLQNLGERDGLIWVDDAISTTPESTIAALDALGDNVAAIILGGQDRGYDFSVLGQRIASSKIKTVILFPGSGGRIRRAIEEANADVSFFEADSMENAVTIAKKEVRGQKSEVSHKSIVLLSTASPSYGMFKNFEEKGDQFKASIMSV